METIWQYPKEMLLCFLLISKNIIKEKGKKKKKRKSILPFLNLERIKGMKEHLGWGVGHLTLGSRKLRVSSS